MMLFILSWFGIGLISSLIILYLTLQRYSEIIIGDILLSLLVIIVGWFGIVMMLFAISLMYDDFTNIVVYKKKKKDLVKENLY